MKKVIVYNGFESLSDFERDMLELFSYPPFNELRCEFQGTFTITVEYTEERKCE